MLLQSYYIRLEVYYSLHICQVFHFVFHNIVDILVMAIKTKILLYFAHISVVICSCIVSEPLTLLLLRTKLENCGEKISFRLVSEIATTVVDGIQLLLKWQNIHLSSAKIQVSH